MEVNHANLNSLYTGYNATFQKAFKGVESQYGKVAMTVPSTTASENYPWLGDIPDLREWIGDRHINNLESHGYTIKNKDFELTISVKKNAIKDDTYGIYSPMFSMLGERGAKYPDRLVYGLLKAGFTSPCYDGQFFFDTDHPVLDENGNVYSVSNTGGGSGTAWFLLDVSSYLKPIIYQEREKFGNLVRLDKADDPNVFMRKEFIYGVDGRANVGFGFWQMAYGSKQPLTPENYAAARAAMGSFKGDHGRPLGITSNLLVVPPNLEGAGRKVLKNSFIDGGNTNEWEGSAELFVTPWLA